MTDAERVQQLEAELARKNDEITTLTQHRIQQEVELARRAQLDRQTASW
jgi:hypothetical protein